MFTKEDLQQIEQQGLTQAQVEQQIENFRKGFPYLNIVRAAAAGDGVLVMASPSPPNTQTPGPHHTHTHTHTHTALSFACM